MSMPIVSLVLAVLVVLIILAAVVIVLALRRPKSGTGPGPFVQQLGTRQLDGPLERRYPAEPGARPAPTPTQPETYR